MKIFTRFGRDRRGMSAVEFALIAPLMLLFYFGLAELCQGLLAERRVNHVASAVGDLITQQEETSVTDLNEVFQIGKIVLRPFPDASLKMVATSVTANAQGVPIVDWSRGYGGMTAKTKGQTMTIPLTLNANDSLVVTEAQYDYNSPFDHFIPDTITFKETSYLRPRKSAKVTCTNDCK